MELPFAITLDVGSSRANRTGSWRVNRPNYVDRLPPCNDACPAGEDIQGWLYRAESGGYREAWRRLVEDNPFPAVMGRICYHPCETACNRAQLDEAVGINAVERFLGDLAIERSWALPTPGADSGKRVLVVGAGPAGLSATYHLRRLGHYVRLVDSAPMSGGMMRYGIPAYRLPRAVLDAEVARIIALGVDVNLDHIVEDIELERSRGGFDAVFLAVGAQLARRIDIPAGDSSRGASTPSHCSIGWRTMTRPFSAAGSLSTGEGTPRSMRPGPPGASAPLIRSSSTGAIGNGCRPTRMSSKRRSARA